MPFKKYRVPIEIFFFWVFPIVVLYFTHSTFAENFGKDFSYFMVFFPSITMYLVVGTGAGYCKFWYFTTSYSPQGVMLTIGFIYSACINLSNFFVYPLLTQQSWFYVPSVGVLTAIFAIIVDIFLLGSGLFYLKSKQYPLGSNPIKHAISYGKIFFTIVGMWNAVGLLIGYQLIQKGTSIITLLLIMPPLFALPFMIRFVSQFRALKEKNLIYGQ